MKKDFSQRVDWMVDSVKDKVAHRPALGIVLGSGLSGLAREAGGEKVDYGEIREFPKPTVEGHAGIMHVTDSCIYMAGRFHYYEGYPMDDVVLPIFLLHGLGVRKIILTNAAGGVNTDFEPGNLVLIKDHINMMGTHPLIGPNPSGFGPRFPDMSSVYSADLRRIAQEKADKKLFEGVYLALSGPSYETPAEINMLRSLGADMVGMSTVPEALIAGFLGMEVLGISCITNMAAGILPEPLNHEEVMATGKKVEKEFTALIEKLIDELSG